MILFACRESNVQPPVLWIGWRAPQFEPYQLTDPFVGRSLSGVTVTMRTKNQREIAISFREQRFRGYMVPVERIARLNRFAAEVAERKVAYSSECLLSVKQHVLYIRYASTQSGILSKSAGEPGSSRGSFLMRVALPIVTAQRIRLAITFRHALSV